MYSITAENITKTYGSKKGKVLAVDEVSFQVNPGEIFGLIGPDGAGKTSVFRILTTLLKADSGTASVQGFDVVKDYREIRRIVGYMPGKFSLYQDLSVEENLNFFASVFNTTVEENYHLIRDIYVQLEPFKDRRAGKLSGGMKQKLALCCALIHKPEVLFLDEPTTGVDPVSRKEFWAMLKSLKEQGITILVATPYMDEAALCDRIALTQKGKILKIATTSETAADFPDDLYEVNAAVKTYVLLKYLNEFGKTKNAYVFGENAHLTVDKNAGFHPAELEKFLSEKNMQEIEIRPIEATIEDTFIQLLK